MKRLELPPGKITIRHRQMRNVYQVFVGNKYLNGVSHDTPEGAAESLAEQYEIQEGTTGTVHGFAYPITIKIPVSD